MGYDDPMPPLNPLPPPPPSTDLAAALLASLKQKEAADPAISLLRAEYMLAAAEEDKAFMADDKITEATANGKIQGLLTATRYLIPRLSNEAEAARFLADEE